MNLRAMAARVIAAVLQGTSLPQALHPLLSSLPQAQDRALVQAMCYGACRFYPRLTCILHHLLKKPLSEKDKDLFALLLVGLVQLSEMRIPAHAAVSETVNATIVFKKPWARSLVNAVLRNYLRQQKKFEDIVLNDEEARTAHPAWWFNSIKSSWSNEWEKIIEANNAHPPFALRVNQQKISRENYLSKLKLNQIQANEIPETTSGIILSTPMLVEHLPGFADGEICVQDGAAQLTADLLSLQPYLRILDACAAPGGKLTHLLEREPQLEVIAVEKDSARMQTIQDNLHRLQQKAICLTADAAEIDQWWDGRLFDRILLDAPCSASGVIRRHPDIKLLRKPHDLQILVYEQWRLLSALWPLLKPGGIFLYVTCSVLKEENEINMEKFLSTHRDAEEEKILAAWGTERPVGRQILPGMHQMDGFYYAKIKRKRA
jgi:16S rRNA (cytosine967-C5)-methyltransferase